MFLVLLACGSAVLAGPKIGVLGIGLCFGLVLVCLCYAIGNISGCHVNPAVSFAVWLTGGMSFKEFVGYVAAQLVGAAIGGGILYWFVLTAPGFDFGGITGSTGLAANVLQPGATSLLALLAEIGLTFFFVFVVLCSTDKQKGAGNLARRGYRSGVRPGEHSGHHGRQLLGQPGTFVRSGSLDHRCMGRLLDYDSGPARRRHVCLRLLAAHQGAQCVTGQSVQRRLSSVDSPAYGSM